MKKALFSTALLACFSMAHANDLPNDLPENVHNFMNEYVQSCEDAGGGFSLLQDAILKKDLTHDGMADYVIDTGAFSCENAPSLFSGTDGGDVVVFVSNNNHANEAFSHGAWGYKLISNQLHLIVGGELCGYPNNDDRCLRPLAWHKKQQKFVFAPLSQKKKYVD